MQTERRAPTVAYEVEAQFAVAAFHTVVHFTSGDFGLAHHDLEVPDQRLHGTVHVLFRGKDPLRNISAEAGLVAELFQFLQRLADDGNALPHLFLAHGEPIVRIAVGAYGNDEVEVLVAAVGVGNAHVVIHTRSAQVGSGEAVGQCPLSADGSTADGAVHEDAVAQQHAVEFLQTCRQFIHDVADAFPCQVAEVALPTADAAHIGGEARAADLLVDVVDLLAPLVHVEEGRGGTGVLPDDGVADDVVGDTRQLHHDHPHVFHTLRKLDADELLHGHVPAHVVDGRAAIVHPVRQRGDLVERTPFRQFLERTVDVADCLFGVQDDLAIQRQHVLEDAVRSRVRRAEVQRGQLAEVPAVYKVLLPVIGFLHLAHRPKNRSSLS